eukprot:scaffold4223_cov189-Amphora_coffeaeformis.AAC.52
MTFSRLSSHHRFLVFLVAAALWRSNSGSLFVSSCAVYDMRVFDCAGILHSPSNVSTVFASALFEVDKQGLGNETISRRCDYYWTVDWGQGALYRAFINGSMLEDDPATTADGLYRFIFSATYTTPGDYEIRSSISIYMDRPVEEEWDPTPIIQLPKNLPPLATLRISEESCERLQFVADDPSAAASMTTKLVSSLSTSAAVWMLVSWVA